VKPFKDQLSSATITFLESYEDYIFYSTDRGMKAAIIMGNAVI
jgi:hypothetical protein